MGIAPGAVGCPVAVVYGAAMELLHNVQVPPGEGPFPTVLALHGWGASAHDLFGLAPILHGGEALVLCPQGPIGVDIGQGMVGFGWFPISMGRPPDAEEFAVASRRLGDFLDAAVERYPIDPTRLVLLGFSQGGVMAYDLFLRQPERFAGLAALSSWLPGDLATGAPPSDEHKGRPVLVMHGTQDPMIPVDRARESRDTLLRYEVNLSFREFDMGHEINPEALRALLEWMEDRVFQLIQLA
ncbi:MAG: dienelactone hydrolase family protein [Myxococcota bacterium]|nr:dienelactone hydrolase family protein [Myxococcota bacterium]